MGSIAACCGGGQGDDPPVIVTTTGADGGGTGAPEDGLDETGGGPMPSAVCLMQPRADRFGYKYQCSGDAFIEVVIEGDFDGSPVEHPLPLAFGPGVPGDGYETPQVMACCPEYDLSMPNCGQQHEQFCMADLAEQGCKSIEPNLRHFAQQAFGGAGLSNAIQRAAVDDIADHVRDHQGDCLREFVKETGVGTTEPSCDAEGNGVEFDALLESGTWTFDPAGAKVGNVRISVVEASWTGVHPLDAPLAECFSAGDNDGVLFLEVDPAPGSEITRLVAGGAMLLGPPVDRGVIEGVGVLDSEATGCRAEGCSRLAVSVDRAAGRATLETLELLSAGPADVGGIEDGMTVHRFAIRLWGGTPAVLDEDGETLVVPRGGARFAVSAVSDARAGAITAVNETPLVIVETPDGWATSELVLGYEDGFGGRWMLIVEPAQWRGIGQARGW